MTAQQQLEHTQHRATNKRFPLRLLAYNLTTANNVGSLFRIADAMAIEHLYLSGGTPLPPSRKIRKTSRSCEKYVPYTYIENVSKLLAVLQSEGHRIICLEITTNSIDIRQLSVSRHDKICLVLGGENQGIDENIMAMSEQVVHIPMLGHNSSMNVANATAIACFNIIQYLQMQ